MILAYICWKTTYSDGSIELGRSSKPYDLNGAENYCRKANIWAEQDKSGDEFYTELAEIDHFRSHK